MITYSFSLYNCECLFWCRFFDNRNDNFRLVLLRRPRSLNAGALLIEVLFTVNKGREICDFV